MRWRAFLVVLTIMLCLLGPRPVDAANCQSVRHASQPEAAHELA
jgi:hypothetical protein